MRIALLFGAAGAVAVFSVGCGSDGLLLPGDGQPAAVAVVDGNNQSAQVGAPLADAVVVRVTDGTGRPVAGATVIFRVTSASGGVLTPEAAITDNAGHASAEWSLGTTAGEQTAEASVEAPAVPPVPLTAFAAAGIPARLEPVSGDDQTAPVGTMLPDSLIVRATDAAGNPVEGVGVTWSSPDGGSVSSPAVATAANGRAGIRRTLGPSAGQQTALASVSGVSGSPVTFSASATTGAAGKLTLVVQPSANAINGRPLGDQPRVQLVDAFNNPVAAAGVAVSVEVDGNPAGVELDGQRTVATDGNGVATFAGLTLTGPPGSYALRFSGASLADVVSRAIQLGSAPVSATRSSVSAAPAAIAVLVQTATLTVTVRDQFGFPVPGISVVPSANPGTGGFAPASASTNALGVATFSFSASVAGEYELSARAGSVDLAASATVAVSKAGTTTSITSDAPDPSGLVQPVVVTFTVTSEIGQSLDGSVTVRENEGSGSCTAPAAVGFCEVRFTGLGLRSLTAQYDGDAVHNESSSAAEPHTVQLFAP
jgi:adhesin/invasin